MITVKKILECAEYHTIECDGYAQLGLPRMAVTSIILNGSSYGKIVNEYSFYDYKDAIMRAILYYDIELNTYERLYIQNYKNKDVEVMKQLLMDIYARICNSMNETLSMNNVKGKFITKWEGYIYFMYLTLD